ncbi:MAG: GntR family transcriptional regulator [Treponemataceae bacterium]
MRSTTSPYDKTISHTIGNGVYFSLRKNIVNLNLKPGESLNVKNIAEKLNVSRTPVRDAFITLEKEGLVDVFPQKGTSVSKIDLKRVDEEKFIRESLEEKAIALFMRGRTPALVSRLWSNLALQRECEGGGDFLRFLDLDDEFHGSIFLSAGKEMSWNIVRNMSGHYRRVRLMSLWGRGNLSRVLGQHEALLKSIESDDLNSVILNLRDHITEIVGDESSLISAYPDYFKQDASEDFLMKDFLSTM